MCRCVLNNGNHVSMRVYVCVPRPGLDLLPQKEHSRTKPNTSSIGIYTHVCMPCMCVSVYNPWMQQIRLICYRFLLRIIFGLFPCDVRIKSDKQNSEQKQKNDRQLLTVDLLARASMKNAANCDT